MLLKRIYHTFAELAFFVISDCSYCTVLYSYCLRNRHTSLSRAQKLRLCCSPNCTHHRSSCMHLAIAIFENSKVQVLARKLNSKFSSPSSYSLCRLEIRDHASSMGDTVQLNIRRRPRQLISCTTSYPSSLSHRPAV